MLIDKNFYPGWTRKSISFTIDDGNIPLDKKFIDIVKPYGIKGTFNLCSPNLKDHTAEFYREMYKGFGISNHCKLHPFAFTPDKPTEISDEKFDSESSDPGKLYPISNLEGMYHYRSAGGWRKVADDETYAKLTLECHNDLEAVFGKGSITTFVWPYGEQNNDAVKDFLFNKSGYTAVRKTGATEDRFDFNVPTDMMHWSYNANHKNMTECALKYENFEDDGELKFFCFGVHSHDFERDNCWDVLENFAKKYGNRPEKYWYASVEDVFYYRDAVNALNITDNVINNSSSYDIYIKVDGERLIVPAKSSVIL